jgi:pyruvate, water dikinase
MGLVIAEQRAGAKARMTVLSAGGVREVAVPHLLRQRLCLAEPQVVALARLALGLEQAMSWPVDLECAFMGETLYLLQCRPITAPSVAN